MIQWTDFLRYSSQLIPWHFVNFGWDHLLCHWTCTTLPVVLCHSEWYVECLQSTSSLLFFWSLSSSMASTSKMSKLQHSSIPFTFLFLMWFLIRDATANYWIFYFQDSEFPYPVVEPDLFLCTRFILPCKNSRLFHYGCVKWPFGCLVRWQAYIWIIVLLKLIMWSGWYNIYFSF